MSEIQVHEKISVVKSLIEAGNLQLALDRLWVLCRDFPGNLHLLKQLAFCLYKLKNFGAASCVFNAILKIEPNSSQNYRNLIEINRLILKGALAVEPFVEKNCETAETGLSSAKIILLCGGEASRWKGHLGFKRKHLVEVEGEVLLHRTLRQIFVRGGEEVVVMVPPGALSEYSVVNDWYPNVTLSETVQQDGLEDTPAYKYLSSKAFWNDKGSTISILGDVWFSEAAMDAIFIARAPKSWVSYGRPSGSLYTGCEWGEIFAHRWADYKLHSESLEMLNNLYRLGLVRESASGWALQQIIGNCDPNYRFNFKNFIVIDDFTDDFDFPIDYDRWVERRAFRGF